VCHQAHTITWQGVFTHNACDGEVVRDESWCQKCVHTSTKRHHTTQVGALRGTHKHVGQVKQGTHMHVRPLRHSSCCEAVTLLLSMKQTLHASCCTH
jgi:hypothetical protein